MSYSAQSLLQLLQHFEVWPKSCLDIFYLYERDCFS